MEALLSLVGALVATSVGCNVLSEAGLLPALLPLLRDTHPGHLAVVANAVRILETFLDYSPPSAVLFRNLGGLSDMVNRLKHEVRALWWSGSVVHVASRKNSTILAVPRIVSI